MLAELRLATLPVCSVAYSMLLILLARSFLRITEVVIIDTCA
jgi:hypothetical protein